MIRGMGQDIFGAIERRKGLGWEYVEDLDTARRCYEAFDLLYEAGNTNPETWTTKTNRALCWGSGGDVVAVFATTLLRIKEELCAAHERHAPRGQPSQPCGFGHELVEQIVRVVGDEPEAYRIVYKLD